MSNIMGTEFSDKTMSETIEFLNDIIDSPFKSVNQIITANPEIALKIMNDEYMKSISEEAELITPDGIGIVYASKLLGGSIKERVSGFDIVIELLKSRNNAKKHLTIYALGANKDTIEKAVQNIKTTYPNINIVGYSDGYFNKEEEHEIVKDINELQPDLLLVGLGSPRQETFIYQYKQELHTKIAIGVGGTFDVLSGNVKRAPKLIQKMNLEWFYRLVSNPKRFKRQLSLFVYGFKVIGQAIKLKK